MRISHLTINEGAIKERFVRASGPGGQNVNKVATAVQLFVDLNESGLPLEIRQRLRRVGGARVSEEGVLLINARRYRTREQNRTDARTRLAALVEQAARPPRKRRPTRPSRAARERRLQNKQRRKETKVGRRRVDY